MEDITKKFIRFLKEHGMYIEYTQEFARQKDDRIRWSGNYSSFKKKINGSIDDFCTNLMNASDILSYSFYWEHTPSGYCIWHELSDKWRKICK